jgi:hypothetical protein
MGHQEKTALSVLWPKGLAALLRRGDKYTERKKPIRRETRFWHAQDMPPQDSIVE